MTYMEKKIRPAAAIGRQSQARGDESGEAVKRLEHLLQGTKSNRVAAFANR